ncbi:hypothetical protein AUC69_00815 [Methyloceanibacter superfactus]|uniref:Uncharacterized protein n=1 Tax=Methyloceanibacter superfactus TaxID=1774969 RepID=A0A1E3W3R5_9HYPH|nr:hypothetical protein AUC69_00815 [Methyloceanibacter superfactus]
MCRRQRLLERRAADARQGAVIVVRVEPAIGDQHVVGMDAPLGGEAASLRQRRGVDEVVQEKVVFGLRGTVRHRGGTTTQVRFPDRATLEHR